MKLINPGAEIFIPDGKTIEEALPLTTHIGIGAHQDDLEIMAYHGILECFGSKDNWFTGVTVTNGAGSPRDDIYAKYTDEDMQRVRRVEQEKAAYVGEYAAQALLDYTSSAVKNVTNRDVVDDLKAILDAARPQSVYTHNLADKHDTHVGTVLRVIQAIRELPEDAQPETVYGCEVWRSLDWMNDEDKIPFDVAAHENLAASLLGIFDSQICGGKRYDLATIGRRRANATYHTSHGIDETASIIYAMDLTPLILDPYLDVQDYVAGYIGRFAIEISARIGKFKLEDGE